MRRGSLPSEQRSPPGSASWFECSVGCVVHGIVTAAPLLGPGRTKKSRPDIWFDAPTQASDVPRSDLAVGSGKQPGDPGSAQCESKDGTDKGPPSNPMRDHPCHFWLFFCALEGRQRRDECPDRCAKPRAGL
jgi:hypothetical protein